MRIWLIPCKCGEAVRIALHQCGIPVKCPQCHAIHDIGSSLALQKFNSIEASPGEENLAPHCSSKKVPTQGPSNQAPTQDSVIIGIDLGTTHCAVAVFRQGRVEMIPNPYGNLFTPSVASIAPTGEVLVGEPALRQAVINPERTIQSLKRLIGRRRKEATIHGTMFYNDFVGGPDEAINFRVDGMVYSLEEIAARLIRRLKESAEEYLGQPVKKAVVGVPASFYAAQRQAIRRAVEKSGLELQRIISEPTAAALAYGYQHRESFKVAIVHFGGGTFDVSVAELQKDFVEVLSTSGDTQLGGDDIDLAVMESVISDFNEKHGVNLRSTPGAIQRLRDAIEKAKHDLSSIDSVEINIPFIAKRGAASIDLKMILTRDVFERTIDPLIDRCREPILSALRDAKLSPSNIDRVILVGGSTLIPRFRRLIDEVFGASVVKCLHSAKEDIASGLAVQGAIIAGKERGLVLLDVTPFSLGVEAEGGTQQILIEKNSTIPKTAKATFSTAADNQTAVTIQVYQGERPLAADNHFVGSFTFEGIRPAPRGIPQIQVRFDIDVDGCLTVEAEDSRTGKKQAVAIENSESSRLGQGGVSQ